MRTERYEEIRLYAEANDLQLIETTNQANGYPSNLEYALIGFRTQEQLEKAEKELSGTVYAFEKRDGWNLWSRERCNFADPYQLEPEDLGYILACSKTDENWMLDEIEQVTELLYDKIDNLDTDDYNAIEDVKNRIKTLNEVIRTFNRLKNDEVLMLGDDYIGCGNYEVIKASELKPMSYYYDTHHYAKGILFETEGTLF